MNSRNFIKSIIKGFWREVFGPADLSMNLLKNSSQGKTCFVLGNGPSLAAVDNEIFKNYPSFGTNGVFIKYVPEFYVTISKDYYKNHIQEIRNLKKCEKFVGDNLKDLHSGDENEHIMNCNWNVYGNLLGCYYPVPIRFSKYADRVVYLGGSVLFVCLQLAYMMGFSRVILLGVDHKFGFPRSEAVYGGMRLQAEVEDSIHFNKSYSKPGYTPHCDMIATEHSFQLALNAFLKDGREIWNATPNTGLDVIPKRDLRELLPN